MSYTIEDTGYSYSGIADVILNENPAATQELLRDLGQNFIKAVDEVNFLQEKLNKLQIQKSYLVSCFIYAHKALKLSSSDPLVFIQDDHVWVVEMLADDKIDWNYYKITI